MTNDLFSRSQVAAPIQVGSWFYRAAAVIALLTVAMFVVLGHGSI